MRDGQCVVGMPETVRDELVAQVADVGFNYLLCQLTWRDLGHEREMTLLRLFVEEVMPAVSAL